jgi:hypothetical protein
MRMESIVRVSRSEWDSFLADYSKLLEGYELLLTQLDTAKQELWNLRAEEQTRIAGSEVSQVADSNETALSGSEMAALRCPFCNRDLSLLDRFCDGCGSVVDTMRCVCGKEIDRGANFCIACGRVINRL